MVLPTNIWLIKERGKKKNKNDVIVLALNIRSITMIDGMTI